MLKYVLHLLLPAALLLSACEMERGREIETTRSLDAKTMITTLPVLGLIIKPIVGYSNVEVLLKDGQSPHSFQAKPSEAKRLSNTSILVYASPIIDGWAANLASGSTIALWTEEEHEDAHFWTDPVAVQTAIRGFSDALCSQNREECPVYRRKAAAFSVRIDSVAHIIEQRLESVKDDCFIVSQPFMTQFLDRFEIRSIGPIQPLPGHDASPRTLGSMMEEANTSSCTALLVQRAVDNRAMMALATDLNVPVREVDHLGVTQVSYEAYLMSLMNALLPTSE